MTVCVLHESKLLFKLLTECYYKTDEHLYSVENCVNAYISKGSVYILTYLEKVVFENNIENEAFVLPRRKYFIFDEVFKTIKKSNFGFPNISQLPKYRKCLY